MKLIINSIPLNLVKLDLCNASQYYGIITNANCKGFVSTTGFQSGKYRFVAIDGMTYGNHFGSGFDTLRELLESRCDDENVFVYQFDTPQELFAWLAIP